VGAVRWAKGEARIIAFRQIPDLVLADSLELPACEHCGQEVLDGEATQRLDEAARGAYRALRVEKLNQALRALKAHGFRQWDLEAQLGLAQGYLSKARVGRFEPAPNLVALLLLTAEAPALLERLK
jgi:hypothetical protein